ncbi:cholesterol 7-desaturase nvd [Ixodes scapularis]
METIQALSNLPPLASAVCAGVVCVITWLFLKRDSSRRICQNVSKRRRYVTTDMPPVFPNGWIPVLESSLLGVNQVRAMHVIGMELVVFRTQDGAAHVMDAYCPHLGAHLGIMGRVVEDCIECPFHGWRFRGNDGACTHVPYASRTPDFVKAKTWLCRESLGFLFIWYHADGEAPSWELEDEPEISSGRWKQTARFERVVYGHIQDICENGADVGHFEKLHKASGLVSGEEYASNTGYSWKGRLLSHKYDISWSAEGTVARTKAPIRVSIFGRNFDSLTVRGLFKLVGPAFFVFHGETRWGSLITTMSLTPVGPLEVKVVHLTFSEPRLPWVVRKAIYMGHRNMGVLLFL